MFFIGVVSALATEVYEHKDNIFYDKKCGKVSGHFHILPVLALGSMVILWVIYVCVFMANTFCACNRNHHN